MRPCGWCEEATSSHCRVEHHPRPLVATPVATVAPRALPVPSSRGAESADASPRGTDLVLERPGRKRPGRPREPRGAAVRHNGDASLAGRSRAAFGRWVRDRPSSRRGATCRRYEELVAHSINGSRSPVALQGCGRTGTDDGNINGVSWHWMAVPAMDCVPSRVRGWGGSFGFRLRPGFASSAQRAARSSVHSA